MHGVFFLLFAIRYSLFAIRYSPFAIRASCYDTVPSMPITYDKLLVLKIPEVEQSYGPKDCILYALGLGFGLDPVDEEQLAFVYEKNLKVLPSMSVVLGYPGFWVKDLDTGIDWVKVL